MSMEEVTRVVGEGPASSRTDYIQPKVFAFQPELGLLAYGDFYTRKLCVVSLENPGQTVFEAYTEDSWKGPWGGRWSIVGVRFCGPDYLVADTVSAARNPWPTPTIDQTDVFHVPTWRRVWTESSQSIRRTCVAPDGSRVAFFRDGILEIGDFDSLENVVAH